MGPPNTAERAIAIDWSGDARNSRRKIWLAEADRYGLRRLENGRGATAIGDLLLEMATRSPRIVVGLDFAFSFPAWFARANRLNNARQGWEMATQHGEQWLAASELFWGRPGRRRPQVPAHFRATELEQAAVGGIRPKSIFQVGGAGAVGTGSLRGMVLLQRLSAAGFHIWPFDPPAWPLVVEIYPRLLTGRVNKRSWSARAGYLALRTCMMSDEMSSIAASSEDAFDAAVSATQMARHLDEFATLPSCQDEETQLEGRIWRPGCSDGGGPC